MPSGREPLTRPLFCPRCGKPIQVTYVAGPHKSAVFQCPYDHCRQETTVGGMTRIISVATRNPDAARKKSG